MILPASRSGPNLSELSDYQSWLAANPGFSLMDYAYHHLTPDLAVAVAKLFWPDFVLHEGYVFLGDAFDRQRFEEWKERFDGDLIAVQRMMNHFPLESLLRCFDQLNSENLGYFGAALAQTWGCALKRQFPDRDFQVSLAWDEQTQDFTISFFQVDTARNRGATVTPASAAG